jgi:hypothetical protein
VLCFGLTGKIDYLQYDLSFGKHDLLAPQQMDGEIKISCKLCGGHISFPHEYLGRKTACPHCASEIILEIQQAIASSSLDSNGRRKTVFLNIGARL